MTMGVDDASNGSGSVGASGGGGGDADLELSAGGTNVSRADPEVLARGVHQYDVRAKLSDMLSVGVS